MIGDAIKSFRIIILIAAIGMAACGTGAGKPIPEAESANAARIAHPVPAPESPQSPVLTAIAPPPADSPAPLSSAMPADASPTPVLEDAKAIGVFHRPKNESDAARLLGKVEDNYLIAIGINRFDDQSVSPLSFCVNDARAVYSFFIANGFVRPSQAYLLHTGAPRPDQQPTRNNILATIQYTADNATPDSTIILHFSGHGFVDEKRNSYMLPQDGKVAILQDTAVSITRVNEMLDSSRARRKILFVDACRNAARRDHKGIEVSHSREFLEALAGSEGQITLASCGEGQFSFEMPETRMGVFTHYLIEGLMGAAPADPSGLITMDSLAYYVKEKVPEWSRANQKPIQQPWSEGRMAAAIPLAIKGQVLLAPPSSEQTAGAYAPVRIPDFAPPPSDTPLVQVSPNAVFLEIVETGEIPDILKGATRPEFISALNAEGIKVVEEKAEIEVQPAWKIRVQAQYAKTSTEVYGRQYENLVLTLSAVVLHARTGEAMSSVKPEEFSHGMSFPTLLRQKARDFISQYAKKTAALVRK